MTSDLIHDRGRGPELAGTRITVYDLLLHFLEPGDTESYICKLYALTPEQVTAARAYVLNNMETVLARHLKIEERIAAGNPPEVIEQAQETREVIAAFKDWLDRREKSNGEKTIPSTPAKSQEGPNFPTFHNWVLQQERRPAERP